MFLRKCNISFYFPAPAIHNFCRSEQNIVKKQKENLQMLIITIRTILIYLLIVFSLRLMGKKQLGELQPSELVTTIMISNIATLA